MGETLLYYPRERITARANKTYCWQDGMFLNREYELFRLGLASKFVKKVIAICHL